MPVRNTPICRQCGQSFDDVARSRDIAAFCTACANGRFQCATCHSIRYLTARFDDSNECHACAVNRWIKPHSALPTLTPLFTSGIPLDDNIPSIGVELEVEGDANYIRTAKLITEGFPASYLICKYDGSLGTYGFEICTRPADLQIQRHTWKESFFNVRRNYGALESFSQRACGLHIHVSRDGISEHALALVVCFVNLPKNRRFIQTIAGRLSNTYCQITQKRMRNAYLSTGDKYEAVNLNHPRTIEFRIFKGTLKAESFYKALEFCEALVRFCKTTYNTRRALAVNAFIRYSEENAERYPHLVGFIHNRWYGKHNPHGSNHWILRNNARPPLPPPDLQEGRE